MIEKITGELQRRLAPNCQDELKPLHGVAYKDAVRQLLQENASLRQSLDTVNRSTSMRITSPLRMIVTVLSYLKDADKRRRAFGELTATVKNAGLMSARSTIANFFQVVKVRANISTPSPHEADFARQCREIYDARPQPNPHYLQPLLVIIADQFIPACVKYRVTQRKKQLEAIGWRVLVVDGHCEHEHSSYIMTATAIIIFRLPFFTSIDATIKSAKRLGIPIYWEVDDLIFNEAQYRLNENLDSLSWSEKEHLIRDAQQYRRCLREVGKGIASTPRLAEFMLEAGASEASVIENALDEETLEIVDRIEKARPDSPIQDDVVWLCFGTGSRARNADFSVAEAGILRALEEDSRLHIHLIGNLKPSSALQAQGARLKLTRETSFQLYMEHLSTSHLTIAPAQNGAFNDCKSAIKFVEASLLGVPVICSPTRVMTDVIEEGVTGFLAETSDDWYQAIRRLCADAGLRARIGAAAKQKVHERFSLESVVRGQVAPLFGVATPLRKERPRVVMANVYFKPQSFGGATLLLESLLPPLRACGFDFSVVTSSKATEERDTDLVTRYDVAGMPVIAIKASSALWSVNPVVGDVFGRWLDGWSADVVHLHAIQNLGFDLAQQCLDRGIPYIITLHDCWWIAENLFITDDRGQYQYHQPDPMGPQSERTEFLSARRQIAHRLLMGAAALLAPSETHKESYVRNGIPAHKITVSANGLAVPKRPHRRRTASEPLRFGYVGGASEAKGWHVLQDALNAVPQEDWRCVIVDSGSNLGISTLTATDFVAQDRIRIIRGYNADSIDDFFDQIDVLLFPSQWSESFGLTVREALLRDVWVIATAPGGQSEPIVEGVNGTIIPIGRDATRLSDAISALCANKAFFEDYKNPFKDRLSTLEDQAQETARIYRQVMASQSE